MSRQKPDLTKSGQPRKRKAGGGRKPAAVPTAERQHINAHVTGQTWEIIDSIQVEQACSIGVAIDLLAASYKGANAADQATASGKHG